MVGAGLVETVFRERWEDPTPLSRNPWLVVKDRLLRMDVHPDPLPDQAAGAWHLMQDGVNYRYFVF